MPIRLIADKNVKRNEDYDTETKEPSQKYDKPKANRRSLPISESPKQIQGDNENNDQLNASYDCNKRVRF